MRLSQLTLPLLSCLPASLAAHVVFNIPATGSILPNPSTLPPSTHATLFRLDNTLSAPITRRNTFDFPDVSPGSYLFTIQCRDFTFAPLRVDVTAVASQKGSENVEVWQTFWGNEWGNKGENRGGGVWTIGEGGKPMTGPVVIETKPDYEKQYYEERQGFDPLSFLKSPMILMGLFSLVLIVGMPYLTEGLDEESKKELEEIQAKSSVTQATNSADAIKNFDMAGWLAGKTSGT